MIKFKNKLSAAGLSLAVALAGFVPAQAAVVRPSAPATVSSDVATVAHRYDHRRGYYRGYRGYRAYRPGYRYHDGYWFPLAAFTAGAIIGGAIAQPAPARPIYNSGINPRHYEWCHARYRSYDARSNTFQPYNGPRRTCYSPYY